MAEVVIAIGTNLGDKPDNLRNAILFFDENQIPIKAKSAIYETEPIGTATETFLNAAVLIETDLEPAFLLEKLKSFEEKTGRDLNAPRWSNRLIDFDIITYNEKMIVEDALTIPHPEYQNRHFVLYPMLDILPDWKDPSSEKSIPEMINEAPEMGIFKTGLKW
jgi:2-amino-4-hydroxy-6-hydroxymethyldihydropteridine diphosphokinase